MPQITLVRREEMSANAVVGETYSKLNKEIDLGLALNEASRILGVYLEGDVPSPASDAISHYLELLVSFDPEDTDVNSFLDDEHFCGLRSRVEGATTQTDIQTAVHQYFNFVGMNLVTVRNLAFIARSAQVGGADAPAINARCVVYYEKYTPGTNELNQLIAWRR